WPNPRDWMTRRWRRDRSGSWFGLGVLSETRFVSLVVQELAHALVPAIGLVVPVERLLRPDEVVLGVVVGHFPNPPHRILGCLERFPVLLQQLVRNLGDVRFEPAGRHRFVHQ